MKLGVVDNDCGVLIRLIEFVEKNATSYLSAFLGGVPFGDGCDRTL